MISLHAYTHPLDDHVDQPCSSTGDVSEAVAGHPVVTPTALTVAVLI